MDYKQIVSGIGEKLKKLLGGEKKVQLIVLAGLVGIALILLSEFSPKRDAKQNESPDPLSGEAYVEQLEQKIYQLVTKIDGVGKAEVWVTLENGVEYVYASQEKKNTDVTQDYSDQEVKKLHEKDNSEQNFVLVDNGSGKEALVRTRIEPKVKGVVVVCQGAEQIEVESRVMEAVKTALGISSTQVCISKMADSA